MVMPMNESFMSGEGGTVCVVGQPWRFTTSPTMMILIPDGWGSYDPTVVVKRTNLTRKMQ